MLKNKMDDVRRYGRTGGFVLAAVLAAGLFLSTGSHFAYSQDAGNASAGSDNSGSASGGDSSGASQGSESNAGANSAGGTTNAGGSADGGATASQNSGPASSDATAGTGATANASNSPDYNANASATTTDSANTNPGPDASTGPLTATASATFGADPSASATTTGTGVNTSASVIGGVPSASAPGGVTMTKVGKNKTIATARIPGQAFSIAIVTRKGAYASSGVDVFVGNSLKAAVKAALRAYATATGKFARARAWASGTAMSSAGGGWSNAMSDSYAAACVGHGCNKKAKQVVVARLLANCEWYAKGHRLFCDRIGSNQMWAAGRRW